MIYVKRKNAARFAPRTILVLVCLGTGWARLVASPGDSLSVFKQFVQVCNTYKHFPLYMNLTVKNNVDVLPTSPGDTASYTMEFFVDDKSSAVRMGNELQMINDSLVLFVNDRQKRMSLFTNPAHNNLAMITKLMRVFGQDTSIRKMAAAFEGMPVQGKGKDTSGISITSKALLPGTGIPGQYIQVMFNPRNLQPYYILYVHNKIVPLDSATYGIMAKDPVYSGKLFHNGSVWFLVKSATVSYAYNQIDYDRSRVLSFQLSSYVIREGQHYNAAKGYEGYRVVENL